MNRVLMYGHNGAGNHGCEAIIRSTADILRAHVVNDELHLISSAKMEDESYGIDNFCTIHEELNSPKKWLIPFVKAYLRQKMSGDYTEMNRLSFLFPYWKLGKDAISLSIGGDNYCYGNYNKYVGLHRISRSLGQKTVLWGCSVEPTMLDKQDVLADLKTFDLITVRETISYEAMKEYGLSNMKLFPDPAFTLACDTSMPEVPLPNTVGINVSPMVIDCENQAGIILDNYIQLMRYILEETDMNITLIPHVIWKTNDDRLALAELSSYFSKEKRITVLEDYGCEKLKQYISGLRFFVGARTHATIAAYSTCVPTLVAGYSVKAKGIAKDLFGTYENYVCPAQSMNENNELTKAFKWLLENEPAIKMRLRNIMPDYVKRAKSAGTSLKRLMME